MPHQWPSACWDRSQKSQKASPWRRCSLWVVTGSRPPSARTVGPSWPARSARPTSRRATSATRRTTAPTITTTQTRTTGRRSGRSAPTPGASGSPTATRSWIAGGTRRARATASATGPARRKHSREGVGVSRKSSIGNSCCTIGSHHLCGNQPVPWVHTVKY